MKICIDDITLIFGQLCFRLENTILRLFAIFLKLYSIILNILSVIQRNNVNQYLAIIPQEKNMWSIFNGQ